VVLGTESSGREGRYGIGIAGYSDTPAPSPGGYAAGFQFGNDLVEFKGGGKVSWSRIASTTTSLSEIIAAFPESGGAVISPQSVKRFPFPVSEIAPSNFIYRGAAACRSLLCYRLFTIIKTRGYVAN
jgi:hypothetical protein